MGIAFIDLVKQHILVTFRVFQEKILYGFDYVVKNKP